jgi:superoxide dismutase
MKFLNLLSNVKHATKNQREKELWDVEGILHNQTFKFDLRPLKNNAKAGTFRTKANKIVYDIKDEYIVVDVDELHNYLKHDNKKVVYLDDLLKNLEWNIRLQKD